MNVWNLIYSDVCRYIDHGEFKNVKLNKTGKLNIFINALFSRHHCVSFLFWLRILGSDDYPPCHLCDFSQDINIDVLETNTVFKYPRLAALVPVCISVMGLA